MPNTGPETGVGLRGDLSSLVNLVLSLQHFLLL